MFSPQHSAATLLGLLLNFHLFYLVAPFTSLPQCRRLAIYSSSHRSKPSKQNPSLTNIQLQSRTYDDYDYEDNDDYYMDDYDDEEPQSLNWEWETYKKSTHVFLPPPIDANNESEAPQTILHFIGGTLFGSYPLQFYKPMLEQIAKQSNSIVVASSIPVTFSKNPLNHFQLAKSIAIEFNKAYRNIVVDEYSEEEAANMNVVGIGHSLGSRLQMIISTSKKLKTIAFDRDANILISFNNYNAVESVPGVKKLEREIEETFNQSKKRKGRPSSSSRYDDPYFDEYEIGLEDVVNAVSAGLKDQVTNIKTTITPDLDSKSLEFQPSPQQLWDGISNLYNIDKTLLVQFDQDLIDQSAKLATTILESNSFQSKSNATDVLESQSNSTNTTSESFSSDKDIKFARLRGTHLSPVSYSETFIAKALQKVGAFGQDELLQEAINESKAYQPSSQRKRDTVENEDIGNLSATIAKYITDIVESSNRIEDKE